MSTADRPPADAPGGMAEAPADEPAASTDVAVADQPGFALERAPIIDSLNKRQLALLQAKAPTLDFAELGQAMELAWAYKLDPYSGEIWFAKSRGGKLLIMVGRDGLRKIAMRNGLDVDGDVIRSKDRFSVRRGPDRTRVVSHEYDGADEEARGQIVAAWAECWDRRTGVQRGFFLAPIGEYQQTDPTGNSPWTKQVSVMTLAAAERQAVRQATPLSGLLVEGEDRLVSENERRDLVAADGEPQPEVLAGVPFRDEVVATLDRARRLGHVGLSDHATAEMTLRDQSDERVRTWLDEAARELDQMEADPEPVDAEVVPDGVNPEAWPTAGEARCAERRGDGLACVLRVGHAGRHYDAQADETWEPEPAPAVEGAAHARDPETVPGDAPPPPEVVPPAASPEEVEAEHAAMRDRASSLFDQATEARESGDAARADDLLAEAEALKDAAGDPPEDAQPELEF